MKNTEQNLTCAENKLDLIQQILQMDCEAFKEIPLLSPEMHYELSEKQLNCMGKNAEEVLSESTTPEKLKDFIINARSFKEMKMPYKNVHFVFIDKKSLARFTKDDAGNEITVKQIEADYKLYYLIVNCDDDSLYDFLGSAYKAYFVDDNFQARQINIASGFESIRAEFLGGIGDIIRKRSTLNGITEYVTFPLNVVDKFRNEQDAGNDIRVKLVCLKKDCVLDGTDANVLTALNDPRRQKKMSMAFQKNNSNFYDIGNMQP